MIEIKLTWTNTSDGVSREEIFYITLKRFEELFKKIDCMDEPIWFEFSFFILEDYWRDLKIEEWGGGTYKIFYDGMLFPEPDKVRQFLLSIMRNYKINAVID